ncbi:MAG: serine protease [Alphaproteobacteria bacterium]
MIRAAATCTASLVVAALFAATAAAQSSPSPVVQCFDEARNVVTPVLRSECKGRIVDDAEAERIRQERLDRIRAGMKAREQGPYPGKKLKSTGSAFFVDKAGHLVTNHHVIDQCDLMTVESPDGARAHGRVVASSTTLDLALVVAEQAPDAIARFSVVKVAPGVRADLFGYPTQGIAPEKPIFAAGEIASEQARYRDPNRFLIEVDVRSGNSGGPVLDQSGLVLGVVFAQIDGAKMRKKTGRMLPDIAVAVRNPAVRSFLAAHGVKAEVVSQAPALDRDAVRQQSLDFVARIACWR